MIALEIILILAFLAAGGFFAGMETGVVATNRLRLQHLLHHKAPGAPVLKYFLDHPDHLLGTTLVGTNLSHVSISVLSTHVAARLFGQTGTVLAPVVMTLVILVFAEYLPKAFFQSNPSARTLPVISLLDVAGRIFHPVNRAIMSVTSLLFPSLPAGEGESAAFITREELKRLTAEAASDGKLGRARRMMIERVFDLPLKTCRQIMIPTEHMVAVELSAPREEIIARAHDSGYSRMPVFEGSRAGIRGIVHILDVLGDSSGSPRTARDYMRPPSYVAADTPADDLLARMRVTRQPMLIVRDEATQVLGLVTTEDVLEEIFGEL
ncbi:MAG TPA: CNNM domain-containing protein [Kiritimatiellia bacterium]|nr:CNNM domain-containing protein [Kiritimatiellia bacterium]HNS81695.1 CNNM domain-containing protein [Kiritimatiellia bacterium]HQQ04668.1 CNNM domain-containing protein [Kiritimatiellia bacterium]